MIPQNITLILAFEPIIFKIVVKHKRLLKDPTKDGFSETYNNE